MTTLAPEWSGLAERYEAASSEQEREAILAETAQHERAEKTRQAAVRKRREDPVTNEWLDAAHAQYMQAEAQCAGKLVRNGSVITDAWALWSGPEWLARKSATEELNNFWDDHPRIPTQTAWREHQGEDVPPDEEISQAREAAVNPLGAAGHIARDAGRAAERTARIAGYQQATQQRAQEMAGQLHAQVAVRGSAAFVKTAAPVDGAQTLEYVTRYLRHMIQFPSEAALLTTALWCMHSHARDANGRLVFLTSPRLLFTSKVPGSGKSWAMEIAAQLCPSPAVMIEPTMPALVHSVGAAHDTVALDEVDVFFGGGQGERKAAARAIINAGYRGSGAYRRMYKGEAQIVPCFGALMMAGLGKIGTNGALEATLQRCHRVVMQKAAPGFRPPRWDRQAQYAAKIISERMTLWASQNLDDLGSHVPDVPDYLSPREAELWEPLLSIADLVGGDWPELARQACEEMIASGGQPPEDQDKLRELDDIMNGWGSMDSEPVIEEVTEEE